MHYLQKFEKFGDLNCRDYIVSFTRDRHGGDVRAEVRVKCAGAAPAERIARYELGGSLAGR